ncbi:protein of unknown function [Brevefilum fermentans]|uniref:Uncharacterized protein n=1 Tax=Candidatus Brevifilum fermentans TaxID=1986204 RepID=A0A1Y6K606_9CHLR|nr:protein of unknown function [Brevefilum fermentans]
MIASLENEKTREHEFRSQKAI